MKARQGNADPNESMKKDIPSKLLMDWVYDAKNDGTYSLGLGHADYCRLCRAVEAFEAENTRLRNAAQSVYDRLNDLGCFTDEQETLRAALSDCDLEA